MNQDLGLSSSESDFLAIFFTKFPQVEQVFLFGSRAMGNHQRYSDFDLALSGEIDFRVLSDVKHELEENTTLPYFFDVVNYDDLDNQKLKEHIRQEGKVIYKRKA